MTHYPRFKPLISWMPSESRSNLKSFFLRGAIQTLYSDDETRQAIPQNSSVLKSGVNLVGYPLADIGEGEFLRQCVISFQQSEIDFGIVDFSSGTNLSQKDTRFSHHIRKDNPYRTNIFYLKPDQMQSAIVSLESSFMGNRYNIGYWVWELSDFPNPWLLPLTVLDEVWCPSRFIQASISRKSSKPIHYMPIPIDFEIPSSFDRDYFGLPGDSFLFLFVFDFKSYMSRKNPLDCIHAFKQAFPSLDEKVGLVLKSMDGGRYPKEYSSLVEAIGGDPRIVLMDRIFRHDEVLGLMHVCDAFVSLHRSEGVGISLAQCMLLGKPVIATNYSGNTDFMKEDNSCLVDYKLIAVGEKEYPFAKGQVWADPDVDQAAGYMHRLKEDHDYRNSISKTAKQYIQSNHHPSVIGQKYRGRLQELGLL